ncbi:unnamed protein product [Closterium sp. NIES-53]
MPPFPVIVWPASHPAIAIPPGPPLGMAACVAGEREKQLERRLRALSENVQGKQVSAGSPSPPLTLLPPFLPLSPLTTLFHSPPSLPTRQGQAEALSSEVAWLQQKLDHTRGERGRLLLAVGEQSGGSGGGLGRVGRLQDEVESRERGRWRGEGSREWGGSRGAEHCMVAALSWMWGVCAGGSGARGSTEDDPSGKSKQRALRVRVWEQVVDAARALDAMSLRVGTALQRNSFVRSLVVAYVLALHLSVFLVLSFVSLEHALHNF